MCHRTTCATCKKPTWSGCGEHIEQALAGVAKADRCQCAAPAKSAGLFARFRGK